MSKGKSGLPEIEICLTPDSYDGFVKINGERVPGLRDVQIIAPLFDVPIVRLDIIGKITGKIQGQVNVVENCLSEEKPNPKIKAPEFALRTEGYTPSKEAKKKE